MHKIHYYLLLAFLPLLMISCSPKMVPFTQQIREQNKLNSQELTSIQFYTSNTIVLRRGENLDKKETSNGELNILKDATVEEVVIKAGTPCVIKEVVDGNRVTVTFESGGAKYLVFGSVNNKDGYYTLMALDWKSGRGRVNYGEKTYLSSPGSRDIFLVLKMKTLEQFKIDRKVEKGVLIK